MVDRGFHIAVRGTFVDNVSKGVRNALGAIRQSSQTSFKQLEKDVQRSTKSMGRFRAILHQTAKTLNATLGGRLINAAGQANNLGQNISSISNRLGFMAFQWNFMANAAARAVDVVVGGIGRIITEGAQMGDSLTRALAFATGAQGIRDQTAEAAKDIAELRDVIFQEGSGKNIFGVDQISNVAKELSKAFPDDIGVQGVKNVLPFVAQLKTIEPTLNDEKIGSGLVSLFATLGTDVKNVEEVAAAMDFLSNVSDKSTANFQSSIASLGVASQQAKTIGITAFETGAIIQNVSDVLARNVGGGRASATAGTYANAFFADLNKIADAESKQGKFARFIKLDIFGKSPKGEERFKDLVSIVEEFRNKFGGLSEANRAAQFSQLGLTVNSQKTLNALLTKSGKELKKQIESLKERGVLEARAAANATSAQAQISRIQAAVNSLKISIADGFAPALFEIANQMSAIAGEKDFRRLMAEIGKIMSSFLIPAIQKAAKLIKVFFGFISRNKKTLRLLVGAVLTLTAALIGLQIISTIGFFSLVAASSLAGLVGQATLAGAALVTLRAGFTLLYASILPAALAGFGFVLVALSLTDIFDKELQPAIFGIGAALGTLGTAFLFPKQTGDALKAAIKGLPAVIGAATQAAHGDFTGFKLLGKNIANAFTGEMGRVAKTSIGTPDHAMSGGLLKTLKNNKLPVIGIAIAIGAAFALWLNNAVKTSPIFKGGLTTYWEEAGIQLKAAVFKTARSIGEIFFKVGGFVRDIFIGLGDSVGKILGALQNALANFQDPAAWEALREAINEAFSTDSIGTLFAELLDPDLEAMNELTKRFKEFRKQLDEGSLLKENLDPARIKELIDSRLKLYDQANLTPVEIIKAVNEGFGGDLLGGISNFGEIDQPKFGLEDIVPTEIINWEVLTPEVLQTAIEAAADEAARTANTYANHQQAIAEHINSISDADLGTQDITDTITKLQEKASAISKDNKELTKGVKDTTETVKKTSETIKKQGDIIGENTTSIKDLTVATDINKNFVHSDTEAVTKDINIIKEKVEMQKIQILEIASNINALSVETGLILRVNAMWARLIGEGNRAAGKLASLKVSSKGKFSIKDPGSSFEDSRRIFEANQIANSFKQTVINLDELNSKLAEFVVIIPELAQVANALPDMSGVHEASGVRSFQVGGAGGRSAKVFTDLASGQSVIDINIDGTFDINVQQGGLTQEQIQDLQDQIGKALTDRIANLLGVQTS